MLVLACLSRSMTVALLAEGVDRNVDIANDLNSRGLSPSSRRAWIEMSYGDSQTGQGKSPSSRRAWIEIQNPCCHRRSWRVALLTEGVDRNVSVAGVLALGVGRPPHGGRG